MVVVTDDPRYFPRPVFALPQMNEFSFPNRLCLLVPRVVEAVHTHLNRAIALHGMDLQRPRNEFSGHFAADILLYAIGQFLSAESHAALIVVELHVIDEEAAELL